MRHIPQGRGWRSALGGRAHTPHPKTLKPSAKAKADYDFHGEWCTTAQTLTIAPSGHKIWENHGTAKCSTIIVIAKCGYLIRKKSDGAETVSRFLILRPVCDGNDLPTPTH